MKKTFQWLLLITVFHTTASDLKFTRPIFYIKNAESYAVFNIEWKNAWKNNRNNDAVWIFFKLKSNDQSPQHVTVTRTGHKMVSNFSMVSDFQFMVPEDGVGLFIYPSSEYRGDIHATIKISLDQESLKNVDTRNASFQVFGVEMVMIPEGGYYLGAPGAKERSIGEFYSTSGDGLIEVNAEKQSFEIGEEGDFYYQIKRGYEGDQVGPVPPSYPKGYRSFHMMKYELTEGQYVNFLNNLSANQIVGRQVHLAEKYNGKIELNEGMFRAAHPDRPCSFVGWDDAMAFADWAGLRPMTELEYTKASRGPNKPVALDFPWGTEDKANIQRLPDANGNLTMINGMSEAELSDENKHYFGASYYWVMDLAGSLWERLITVGHSKGREFAGSHGDGMLTESGRANTADWPIEEDKSGGIGFRGGGFYGYDRSYHDYNPFSPISFRPYGGWHGGMRSIAYGTRFVRSMD